MHEAVLQVLQSLNVMLVMTGHVKEGQGPAASTTRPQRLSWAHDPNLQHTISVWGGAFLLVWFCLCDCFNHPPGVSISFPATLPLLVRIHWKQGRRREQTPWDNDFPPSQAGGSRRRRSPVPAPQAALAMEKKHQRQGTPQVRQELFLGPVCSFRLSLGQL